MVILFVAVIAAVVFVINRKDDAKKQQLKFSALLLQTAQGVILDAGEENWGIGEKKRIGRREG